MKKTPLDEWIRAQILPDGSPLTRRAIKTYQLEKIREMVSYAGQESPFYRRLFGDAGSTQVWDWKDVNLLPFTTSEDLREQGMKLLCTPLEEIERVVTLETSGTTGSPKRLCFTAEDLAATADFFRCGMSTLVQPGETVLILLPGERPDSVGTLLAGALASSGIKPVVLGPVTDCAATRAELLKYPGACLVGIPTQILSLARSDADKEIPFGWVKSVLLASDYVPHAIRSALEQLWGCLVLEHYGMTETGLGGGVECEAAAGYHMREADLYTEIIDPETGERCPDGCVGEVVFTTLSRRGMPLIRYRTGDLARLLEEPCPCGSSLKRLEKVQGRSDSFLPLHQEEQLSMAMLDEALFPIAGLLNFSARLTHTAGRDQLHLCLQVCEGEEERVAREVLAVVMRSAPLAPLFKSQALSMGGIDFNPDGWFTSGTGKRKINDDRKCIETL